MRRTATAALVALALSLSACGGEEDEGVAQTPARTNTQRTETTETTPRTNTRPTEEGSQIRVVLNEQNGSGIGGTATLSREDNGTEVELELDSEGGPHPAHIHAGSCDDLDPTPKVSLSDVRNGRSRTEANVSLQTLLAETHSVNVHRSAQKLDEYVACGEITGSQG